MLAITKPGVILTKFLADAFSARSTPFYAVHQHVIHNPVAVATALTAAPPRHIRNPPPPIAGPTPVAHNHPQELSQKMLTVSKKGIFHPFDRFWTILALPDRFKSDILLHFPRRVVVPLGGSPLCTTSSVKDIQCITRQPRPAASPS